MKIACSNGIKSCFEKNYTGYDARKYGKSAIDFVKAEAIKKIRAFSSNNKGS
ncbi:class II fructose-bisphosphate aldolase [Spiroplasma gladiatoris]|uniref:Class II fructose-bisphosphate aldolase n=1 Tax=Spiroplasma gladiatoris TaxID=2143 RepID=A0A4P7AGA3_9MOLU|nr:class II fructose-bisphosphate aldolase [Spiroplasma gladiatoris]